eukprot:4821173-Alexandrium_andersonii.AAC.1
MSGWKAVARQSGCGWQSEGKWPSNCVRTATALVNPAAKICSGPNTNRTRLQSEPRQSAARSALGARTPPKVGDSQTQGPTLGAPCFALPKAEC